MHVTRPCSPPCSSPRRRNEEPQRAFPPREVCSQLDQARRLRLGGDVLRAGGTSPAGWYVRCYGLLRQDVVNISIIQILSSSGQAQECFVNWRHSRNYIDLLRELKY